MNLRRFYALVLVSSLVELGACKSLLKKRDPDPAPSAAPVLLVPPAIAPLPSTPPAEIPALQAAVDETTVPTSQDFEDDAFSKVTTANFRAQFAQLKSDIGKP